MTVLLRLALLFLIPLVPFTAATSNCPASAANLSPTEYYPKDKLKPGMRGITYTVLQGEKIEPLETEILGIAKNYIGPGLDLIIAKLVDPKTAVIGAVHGMSGSPLYVDGKLVGALSRRIASFEKDGHCGFTPIEDMFQVEQLEHQNQLSPSQYLSVDQRSNWNLLGLQRFGGRLKEKTDWLAVPLTVSGISQNLFEQYLKRFGWGQFPFLIVSGGASSSASSVQPESLQPGAPVSAVMMTGDISIGGTGTLTWRNGTNVLAFGHPMFGFGKSNLPMAMAEVITTIPSYETPYKLANIGNVIGTILEDRLSAIGGKIGPIPTMASYSVNRIHNDKAMKPLEGRFISHPSLSPMLVNLALAEALSSTDNSSRTFAVKVEGKVQFENLPPLALGGFYSGHDTDLIDATVEITKPLSLLFEQPWIEPKIKSLDLSVVSSEKEKVWMVEKIYSDYQKYQPAAQIHLQLELKEKYGERLFRSITLPIPPTVGASTPLNIRVISGNILDKLLLDKKMQAVTDVHQLIDALNQRHKTNCLYIQLFIESPGEIRGAHELPSLPPSLLLLSNTANISRKTIQDNELLLTETEIELPGMALADQTIKVEVQ
ncbi:sporulation protein SpoOM [Methylacidiphilum kamchatkense Kam1]|uniref:SpoIVB peptidase S55 n=1 Tax=Methylacidiphilum kamchatkense Kam1 TaxID=1202785 RepID=A0A0C1RSU9_9BACT|nr:SpoIVB peptidase S55 domain-containing protein [Methylacidiphilum kamchatkense]KIE58036.1 sporulation protein SpoOM [Methylacidiphilum kamchatkense Kam1]QDQ41656.1 SpoIVB peptidase S55 [Methylacidiphilum kamchatkense Kam1]